MPFIPNRLRLLLRSRNFCVRVLVIALAPIIISASFSGIVFAATPAAKHFTIPLRRFVMNYLKDADVAHYQPSPNFLIAGVWLYSPQGKLMALAGTDANLDTLIKEFPPAKSTAPANQADLKTLLGVISKSAGAKATLGVTAHKWTAVLFLSNSLCNHCTYFEQSMREFARAQSASLDTVTVMLKNP